LHHFRDIITYFLTLKTSLSVVIYHVCISTPLRHVIPRLTLHTCIQNVATLASDVPEIHISGTSKAETENGPFLCMHKERMLKNIRWSILIDKYTLTTHHLWGFDICKLSLDIVYMYAKSDDSSCNPSRDMVGVHQNLYGSRYLPLSEMVCHQWASTCSSQPMYQPMYQI